MMPNDSAKSLLYSQYSFLCAARHPGEYVMEKARTKMVNSSHDFVRCHEVVLDERVSVHEFLLL